MGLLMGIRIVSGSSRVRLKVDHLKSLRVQVQVEFCSKQCFCSKNFFRAGIMARQNVRTRQLHLTWTSHGGRERMELATEQAAPISFSSRTKGPLPASCGRETGASSSSLIPCSITDSRPNQPFSSCQIDSPRTKSAPRAPNRSITAPIVLNRPQSSPSRTLARSSQRIFMR
jgi:hypothetical protein